MPDDRDSLTEPENEFTDLAKEIGDGLLDSDAPVAPTPALDSTPDQFGFTSRWGVFGADGPISRIGGRVRDFRRIRWGRPTPPFKSGPFNDDDGCLRGCFYPVGCLFWVLVGILVVIVGGILLLSGGDGDDGNLVSGGGVEASPSVTASPAPSAEASSEPSAQPSAAPTDAPTAVVTETPAVTGPVSITGTSGVDHPPFARPYSNVGASVLLACLRGDPVALAGAIATILFEGAGLGSTTLSGEFDSSGLAVIEVAILNFGTFNWSVTSGEASDGAPLEISGGDSGTVDSSENPDACGP